MTFFTYICIIFICILYTEILGVKKLDNKHQEQQNNTSFDEKTQSNSMNDAKQSTANNTTNAYQNIKHKKPKKHGCLWAFLKFIFFSFLIIALIVGSFIAWIYFSGDNDEPEELLLDVPNWDQTEYIEQVLNQQSDIEGLTVEQKLEAGLDAHNGSDTDGDGLTDAQEIELGSDPLKFSTAGDMYPDSYKHTNNIAFNEQLEGTILEYHNPYENLAFNGLTGADYLMSVQQVHYAFSDEELATIAYRINNFNGTVTIDFSEHITEGYSPFMIVDTEVTALKLESSNIATAELTGEETIIALFPDTLNDINFGDFLGNIGEPSEKKVLYLAFPLFTALAGTDHYVFETSSFAKNGSQDAEKAKLVEDYLMVTQGIDVSVEHAYLPAVNISFVYNFFANLHTMMVDAGAADFADNLILCKYYEGLELSEIFDFDKELLEQALKEQEDTALTGENYIITSFRLHEDAFSFPNLGTEISPDGVCMGMSHIAMATFNGNIETAKTGESYVDDVGATYAWDLSGAQEATFFDKGLYDYKYRTYYTDTYSDDELIHNETLSDVDVSVLNYLGVKWNYGNDQVNAQSSVLLYKPKIEFSRIEDLIEGLKQNKVYNVTMAFGGSGHAVTATGVRFNPSDENKLYIKVYDNNFPNGIAYDASGNAIQGNFEIIIEKHIETYLDGLTLKTREVFTYYYKPFSTSSYGYNNTDIYTGPNTLGLAFQPVRFDINDEHYNMLGYYEQ